MSEKNLWLKGLDKLPQRPETPVEQEIAKIEEKVTTEVAAQAPESVLVEGWGVFYRRDEGWHNIDAGYFGPGTPGAKMCEEALALKKKKGG